MKNITIKTKIAALSLAAMTLVSCTGDFFNMNKNDQAPGEWEYPTWILVGSAVSAMQTWVIPVTDNPYQMAEATGSGAYCRYFGYSQDQKWPTSFGRFNAAEGWVDWPFQMTYNDFYSYYSDVIRNTEEGSRWHALANVLKVSVFQRTTDMYGPISYSTLDPVNPREVVYDSQEVVYKSMLDDLNEAIRILTEYASVTPTDAIVGRYDNLYAGDLTKWVKYANSLKMRLAIRMSLVEPELARTAAEEAVNHSFGIITSNSDNAILSINKAHPLNRTVSDYNDTRAAAEIICFMEGWSDPRISHYFDNDNFGTGTYSGLRLVTNTETNAALGLRYSSPRTIAQEEGLMWMNAAEMAFIMAEGALLRGWTMPDTPENLYNQGIKLSFDQWGISQAAYDAYIADDTSTPNDYVDPGYGGSTHNYAPGWTLKVKWDDSDNEVRLEQIITQKWLAIYPLSNEAWAEMRRTGYPRFYPSINYQAHPSGGTLSVRNASRYPFPFSERRLNPEKYQDAVNKLGGDDDYTTRLWWDVKTNKPGW